jgi:sigma-E factor negative regulatory protein RseA
MVMNEELSRLMDGDLDEDAADRAVAACRQPAAFASWCCYQVIGDALRGAPDVRPGFTARFTRALAAEPTVLAPRRRQHPVATWAWAAAASIAAVTVVGWTALSLTETPGTALAKAREASAVTAASVRPQWAPPEYVLVHQEYAPTTALQGVSPYLRAVAAPAADARP